MPAADSNRSSSAVSLDTVYVTQEFQFCFIRLKIRPPISDAPLRRSTGKVPLCTAESIPILRRDCLIRRAGAGFVAVPSSHHSANPWRTWPASKSQLLANIVERENPVSHNPLFGFCEPFFFRLDLTI